MGALLLGTFGAINTEMLSHVISTTTLNPAHTEFMNQQHGHERAASEGVYDVTRAQEIRKGRTQATTGNKGYLGGDADGAANGVPFSSVTLILQSNPSHCGLAALAMLLSYHSEVQVSLASLEQTAALLLSNSSHKWKVEGFSVGELQILAKAFGTPIYADRVSIQELSSLQLPLLAWINTGNNGHFTVVQAWQKNAVFLADPTRGYVRLEQSRWEHLWLKGATGIVLTVDERLQR